MRTSPYGAGMTRSPRPPRGSDTPPALVGRRSVIAGLAGGTAAFSAIPNNARAVPAASLDCGRHLFVDLSRAAIAADTRRIITAGRGSVGRFAAAYVLDPTQGPISSRGLRVLERCIARGGDRALAERDIIALEKSFRVRIADGRWFVLDDPQPLAGHFGAMGDAVYDETTGVFSGTDDTAALQALIDWTLYWYDTSPRSGIAVIGAGAFRLTRPIIVGRNDGFYSVTLVGAGMGTDHAGSGTRLFVDHESGPGLSLSGLMNSGISQLHLIGRHRHRLRAARMGALDRGAVPDDLDLATWLGQADDRYAPYAAVAVDPYRGDRPPGGYDSRADRVGWLDTRPDLYGGNAGSGGMTFDRVAVAGFGAGFAVQPCDSDGNGDFTRFRDCTVSHCARGWSIGNSQARAVELTGCIANGVHTVLTSSAHGRRNGSLKGRIDHLSVGESIQVFEIANALAVAGPVSFVHLYGEALYRLGTIGRGSQADAGLRFENCALSFDRTARRGTPAFLLGNPDNGGYGPSGNRVPIVFQNCAFSNFGPVLTLFADGVELRECTLSNARPDDDARRIAANALAALALGRLSGSEPQSFNYIVHGSDGRATARAIRGRTPPPVVAIDKAALVANRFTGGTWRFSLPTGNAATAVGAALLDLSTGCLFAVSDVRGADVVAILLTPTDPIDPAIAAFVPDVGQARLLSGSAE